jgi:hypothetical protein
MGHFKGYSFLGCNALLLNRYDGANSKVCGSLATCVQEGMRPVARLRHTEGLSGVFAVWPAFIGISGTVTVLVHVPCRECWRSSTLGRFYC